MIDFTVPLPPSANRLWRRSGRHIHKSSEYQAWLSDAGFLVRLRINDVATGSPPQCQHGPYKLTLNATRPDKRRRDLDNLIKPIGDLITSIGLVEDDSKCEMISARWVTTGEGVYVRVEPAGIEQ